MKVMCLFHGRKIVSTRRCQRCLLLKLERENERDASETVVVNFDIPLSNNIFPCAIRSPAGWLDDVEERNDHMKQAVWDKNFNEIPSEDERTESCEVCRSMWWNADGKWVKYDEPNIGKYLQRISVSFFFSLLP